METLENGMLAGCCRYCFEITQNSDGICSDCQEDIKIAEELEKETQYAYRINLNQRNTTQER